MAGYHHHLGSQNSAILSINTHQVFTKGISIARLCRPDLRLNGLGAHNKAMPFAVWSVYNGLSCKNGWMYSGNSKSSLSSGNGSACCKDKVIFLGFILYFVHYQIGGCYAYSYPCAKVIMCVSVKMCV